MVAIRVSLFIALAAIATAELPEEEHVLVLSSANFDEALALYPELLVEFYAPWCGHCKKLAPEYAKAAAQLKARHPPIRIAKVDATENTELATKYGVKGYPSLKYFIDKVPSEYTGGRVEEEIVSWLVKKTEPAYRIVTAAELKDAIDSKPLVFVLFSRAPTTEFENVAKAIDKVEFLVSSDAEALATYEVKAGSLVLFKSFDDRKVEFDGRPTTEELVTWLSINKRPFIMPFDDEAIELIFRNANPALILFRSEADASNYEVLLDKLSKKVRGVISVTVTDLSTEANKRLADYLGLKVEQQPLAFLVDTKDPNQKYRYEGELTVENLTEFVGKWKNKTLKPTLKSDPIPSNPYDGAVRVLVGKNFNDVVYDLTKDIFVEFYAPWCAHCKELAPKYARVGEAFRGDDSIIIAKIDSSANEVLGHSINGFPTMKFFTANNKAGIDYRGPREEEAIIAFIKENAKARTLKAERKNEL